MIINENQLTYFLKLRSGLLAGKPLGDRIADFTHQTHLDQLTETYTEITGKDCGCKDRQNWLNKIFPG